MVCYCKFLCPKKYFVLKSDNILWQSPKEQLSLFLLAPLSHSSTDVTYVRNNTVQWPSLCSALSMPKYPCPLSSDKWQTESALPHRLLNPPRKAIQHLLCICAQVLCWEPQNNHDWRCPYHPPKQTLNSRPWPEPPKYQSTQANVSPKRAP